MKEKNSKVAEWKLKEVEEIKKLLDSATTIAVVNLENLPAKQYQIIRNKLKDQINLKMSKKNFMLRAIEKSSNPKVKDLESLSEDILSAKGFWRNKITRILLVVVFTNLGSSIGTFVAIPLMTKVL